MYRIILEFFSYAHVVLFPWKTEFFIFCDTREIILAWHRQPILLMFLLISFLTTALQLLTEMHEKIQIIKTQIGKVWFLLGYFIHISIALIFVFMCLVHIHTCIYVIWITVKAISNMKLTYHSIKIIDSSSLSLMENFPFNFSML